MISRLRKFVAQVSFLERITTPTIKTEFFISLFLEVLTLTNLIIIAQTNNLSKFNPNLLFILHVIRFDFMRNILPTPVILISCFIIFFYFIWHRNRSKYFGSFSKVFPVGCAMSLIQIENQIYHNIEKISAMYFECSIIFMILSIWIMKMVLLPQNYLNKQCKLTKYPALLRTSIFIIQIIALIFKIHITQFLVFTLIIEIFTYIYSLMTFQNICKDFEYLYFLSRYLIITVNLFYLIQVVQFLPENRFTQYIPYIFFLFLYGSGSFRIGFQKKYNGILNKSKLTPKQIIILYNLLIDNGQNVDKNMISIFKFSFDNFAWNIMIKRLFDFQKSNKQYEAKLISQSIYSSMSDDILDWLEKQQMTMKSGLLTLYLCFTYLSQKKYLKAIQYLMKARKIKNYEKQEDKSSTYELIYYELQNYKSICDRLNTITEQQYFKWCLISQEYKSLNSFNHINSVSLELQFQELIKRMEILFNKTETILKRLINDPQIQSKDIKNMLLQKIQQKHQIETLLQQIYCTQEVSCNKRLIFIYYVYLNVCCSQSYTLFQRLQPLLQSTTDNNTKQYLKNKSSQNDMVAMISLQDKYMGVIQYANIIMKSFFSLKQDRINSKTEHIQRIIPKFIASRHNELMMKFKKIGKSNFIGQSNRLIVIQNKQIPYEANIDIKMFVSLDGNILLTSRILLIKEQEDIILFNTTGQIFENTLNLNKNTYSNKTDTQKFFNLFSLIGIDIKTKVQTVISRTHIRNFKNKLARITIESMMKGNPIKICKIKFLIDKVPMKIKPIQIIDEEIISQLQPSEQQHKKKCLSQEIKLVDLECKIYNIKFIHNTNLFKFTFAFIVFLIISLSIIFSSYNYLQQQFESTRSITTFYTNILNGFRVRFFLMNNRYLLLHAINSNIISNDIASPYNISNFSQYIKDTTAPYLSNFDYLDSMVYDPTFTIPSLYMNKFKNPLLSFKSPYQFQISWISMLALTKSFYHQAPLQSSHIFQTMWDNHTLPFINYLDNDFFSQINEHIYNPIINSNDATTDMIKNNIDKWICFTGILILFLIVCILCIMNNIHSQIESCVSLLSEIDASLWKSQSEKIKLVKECLKMLNRTIIVNYDIDYESQSILYQLGEEDILMMKQGQIYLRKLNKNDAYNRQKQQEKRKVSLKNPTSKIIFIISGFIKTHLCYILIIIFFSLPIFSMLLWYLNISTSNHDIMTFFYRYIDQIANFRISLSIMVNIVTAKLLLPTSTYINNMNVDMMITTLKSDIFNRTYEDILKNQLPWNLISSYLYTSNCNKTDQLCKTLISGSLNKNTPQAILQFSNLNFMLYSNRNNMMDSTQAQKNLLCQIWITSQKYLRPIILQIQTNGLNFTNQKISSLQRLLYLIFQYVILPFTIIFLLLSYCVVYRMLKQLYEIKKQILMSDKVDHLIKKTKFWSQFIKLKQQ